MQLHRRVLLRAAAAIGVLALGGRLAVQAQPKTRVIPIVAPTDL